MDFLYSYIALAEIYVLLGLSTNLLVGVAGIFSVSQAAVFGVGAYVVAFFLMHDIMGFVPALMIAAACCVALNVLVTLPSPRRRRPVRWKIHPAPGRGGPGGAGIAFVAGGTRHFPRSEC